MASIKVTLAKFCERFAADAQIKFEYQPLPVKRLFAALASGAVDFKYPDNPHWNKPAKACAAITYSGPVAPYIDGVLAAPGQESLGANDFTNLGHREWLYAVGLDRPGRARQGQVAARIPVYLDCYGKPSLDGFTART